MRKFRNVRVWSPRPESREAFVGEWHAKGIGIRATHTAEACVEGADVIAAATSSMVRVIEPRWLRPGVHTSCIKTQEIDAEVLNRCDRVVFSMKETPNVRVSRRATGGMTARCAWSAFPTSPISRGPGRRPAAGAYVLKRARAQRVGTELPDDWFTEEVHP